MLTKKHFLRFKWLVKRALSLPLGLLSETRGIRILAYHRVTDEVTNELAVSVATFLTQMEWLMKRHRVITLDEAVNLLLQDKTINESYTVLTFDDGYADFYDNVYPILSRLGLPATVFVPLGYVSTNRV
ncbi:MAG TPA: polysaccharide deacetylase family protein, partial [Bacillota bacterium]|nr:polysaccharide deacetylase family protein [Bacillota bacterium]